MTDMIPHARSAGVRNPYLNMFKVPPTDLSMSSRRFVRINPFNVGINPVTFQVDPQEDFIDLKESYFEVDLAIRKGAEERPFGYMLLDLHPASQDDARVLSHTLKDEGVMRCYQFKPSC